ncbi:hypothetical protein COL154_009264 [Colletotrichum chrysophilum]|nr:hypothetical protein COL154_009264 [Colletotrichum chrysophilum]
MEQKIGIFPASGGIGGGTVKHILNRLSPKDLVFIARHPEKLASEAALGAEVRRANYDEDATVQVAFRGIKTLFLISYASVEHEHRVESHPGFDFTIIREGLYTESYPLYTAFFDPAQPRSEVKIPHDGSGPGIAWVKREELGEGTAELILRYVRDPQGFAYRSKTVLLSGNKSLTLSETVKILSKIANIPVTVKQVSDDEFATQPQVPPNFTYHGVDYSKAWASSFEAFRREEAASASSLLSELLGREPEEFETTVRKSMSA